MTYKSCLLITLSWLISVATGWGQVASDDLNVDHLTISDGLSHNTVHCLLQDRHGYMWVGTQYGLSRYDGYRFEAIASSVDQEIQENFSGKKISALYEDRSGNLWVGTGKHGISVKKSHSDQFVHLSQDSSFVPIIEYEVTSFFEDNEGGIWITTIGGGALRYDPRADTSRHYTWENSGLSNDLVFDVVQDQHGTIWVATAGGGLNVLEPDGHFSLSHPMLPNHPNMSGYRKRLFLDGDYLWVGTEGTGLYRMKLADRSYVHYAPGNGSRSLSSNGVRDMWKTTDGRLFVATDGGGLNILDPTGDEVAVYSYYPGQKTGLNSNALFCLWEDRTGNVWMGTYNGGINIYKPGKVWFKRLAPGLPGGEALKSRSILSLAQTRDGKVWVGTDGGGLNWQNPDSNRFSAPPFLHVPGQGGSLAGNVVKTLFEDSRNRLWVGLFGQGLDRYDPQTNTFAHILGGPNNVWSMAEQADGLLWVATVGGGLVSLDPETLDQTRYSHDPDRPGSLTDLNVMVVFVDQEDQVWAGTVDQGLDRWDEAKQQFVHYRHDPADPESLSNNEIRAIFQDSRGNLWIGTEGGGLNRWLGQGRFERIGKDQGLLANSVMGIAEDCRGMLWVTTFEGISRLNPVTLKIRNFDFRTPQAANQFNQEAILALDDGTLLFGGINGLNTLHPERLPDEVHQAHVTLTGLQVANQPIPVGQLPDGRIILTKPIEEAENIRLSYLDKSFSLEFSAMDFTNPMDMQYAYKMENFDEDWQETEIGQNSVTYTNLDPGSYTFRVKYRETIREIEILIDPPFWQTLWFRGLLTLVIMGLVLTAGYVVVQRRETAHKRQLLQLQNEKLASELEAKTSNLMYSSVQIAHKNEILTDLKEKLLKVQKETGAPVTPIIQTLNHELKNEDHWKEFDLYFNQVDKDFIQSLREKHSELTPHDLRMCSLIRINLSTKEIAYLLNVSTRAVEQGRYRLKKRLGLGKEEDLIRYITGFDPQN